MTAAPAPTPSRPAIATRQAVSGPASKPVAYVLPRRRLVLMVGPFLWMVLGSLKPEARVPAEPADVPAVGARRPTTTAGCSTSSTSRASSSTRPSSPSP